MADQRNDIIHGWGVWDDKIAGPAFRNKKKPSRSAGAKDIEKLCKRLSAWLDEFRDEVRGFLEELDKRVAVPGYPTPTA